MDQREPLSKKCENQKIQITGKFSKESKIILILLAFLLVFILATSWNNLTTFNFSGLDSDIKFIGISSLVSLALMVVMYLLNWNKVKEIEGIQNTVYVDKSDDPKVYLDNFLKHKNEIQSKWQKTLMNNIIFIVTVVVLDTIPMVAQKLMPGFEYNVEIFYVGYFIILPISLPLYLNFNLFRARKNALSKELDVFYNKYVDKSGEPGYPNDFQKLDYLKNKFGMH